MARKNKSSLASQEPFPVFRLPAELRCRIWRFVVVNNTPVIVYNRHRSDLVKQLRPSSLRSGTSRHVEDDQWSVASQLAIAFTRRQAYLEVTPIYYCENTFSFDMFPYRLGGSRWDALKKFPENIGPDVASSITSIMLVDRCRAPVGPTLCLFPGLESLEVDHIIASWWPTRYKVLILDDLETFARSIPGLKLKVNGKTWDPEGEIRIRELAT